MPPRVTSRWRQHFSRLKFTLLLFPNRIDSSVSIGRIEKGVRKFENDDCTSADDQLEKAL